MHLKIGKTTPKNYRNIRSRKPLSSNLFEENRFINMCINNIQCQRIVVIKKCFSSQDNLSLSKFINIETIFKIANKSFI